MANIAYKLVEGVNRVQTEALEVADSIILEAEAVFVTDHPAVQRVLDAHPDVKRTKAPAKGGESAPPAADETQADAPAADETEAAS